MWHMPGKFLTFWSGGQFFSGEPHWEAFRLGLCQYRMVNFVDDCCILITDPSEGLTNKILKLPWQPEAHGLAGNHPASTASKWSFHRRIFRLWNKPEKE
jgi:hypothetical protein